jgi:hypothetical protein
MSFSFLAPLFLAGLAAIAIPILIHLTHRERKEAVPFPSLMFVRRVPYRTVRRQRIRHWLLFLMRVAAIALVALAFARPWLESSTEAVASFARSREIVVLLDRSYSMAYADRWSRAIEAARGVVGNMGPDDRATLVTFSERAEAATQPTGDAAVLLAALNSVDVGAGVTRYGPAFQLAHEIVERSDLPSAEVLLISDLQKSGWDPRSAVRLPPNTRLNIVDLSDDDAANVSVPAASITRSRRGGREEIIVTASIANHGPDQLSDVSVALIIDGERVESQDVNLEPGQATVTRFGSVALPGRPVRGIVRAGDDPLPGDNAFHFVVAPEDPVSVLIVEPRAASANHNFFLTGALAIGDRPGFNIDTRRVTRLATSDLDGRSVVIFNDAPIPGGDFGRRLTDLVEDGLGVLVILGRRSPPGAWPSDAPDLLPGSFGGPVDRAAAGGGTLGYLDYDHPAFEIFRAPRSGDFSAARFYRYRRLEVAEGSRTLARFDDGSSALLQRQYGDGGVMMWATGVENFWNDLAIQPVFLPFTHQVVKHLAGYREADTWFRVGQVVDLSQNSGLAEGVVDGEVELIIESPYGRDRVVRPARDTWLVRLDEPGFFEVRSVGDENDIRTMAANLDPSESDLATADLEEMAGALIAESDGGSIAAEATMLSAEERERHQGLWWYLLAAAITLLLAETLLSNRVARVAT